MKAMFAPMDPSRRMQMYHDQKCVSDLGTSSRETLQRLKADVEAKSVAPTIAAKPY